MKKLIATVLAALMLCGMFFTAAADEPDSYVAMNGQTLDQQTYAGTWQEAYRTILDNHSAKIRAYQNRRIEATVNGYDYNIPMRPVSLMDLNSDGLPELIFMELANEYRGDLYIYTTAGSGAKCMLVIPGITRPGYDDLGLPFSIYLSSNNGGTLVTEYYEYEKPWVLQFVDNGDGRYYLLNSYTVRADYSGESYDVYLWNGYSSTYEACQSMLDQMRIGRTMVISEFFAPDYSSYGLNLSLEDAANMLGGTASGQDTQPVQPSAPSEVYGLTIQKLATRKGPGTQYEEGGTYFVENQWIKVLSKAYDKRNEIWWVKCEIPYHGEIRVLWTGYKRFDHSTLSLDDLPEENW